MRVCAGLYIYIYVYVCIYKYITSTYLHITYICILYDRINSIKFHEARFGGCTGFPFGPFGSLLLAISWAQTVWIFPVLPGRPGWIGVVEFEMQILGRTSRNLRKPKDIVSRSVLHDKEIVVSDKWYHIHAYGGSNADTPPGLGHEHNIRYTVCLWIAFALTEKGNYFFKMRQLFTLVSSNHSGNLHLVQESKAFRCLHQRSFCRMSVPWCLAARSSVEMQKHGMAWKFLLTEFGCQLNPLFFLRENSSNNRH